jgi:hypothetical protein
MEKLPDVWGRILLIVALTKNKNNGEKPEWPPYFLFNLEQKCKTPIKLNYFNKKNNNW